MRKVCFVFLLMAATALLSAQAADLFFSEYIEGSSQNKALEIFNGTGADVNLDNYQIAQASNGGGWSYYHAFPAGTILADGDVWVITTDQAAPALQAAADESLPYPSVVHFNGDDARMLQRTDDGGNTWIDVDCFGDPDNDPGSAWDVAGVTGGTGEHTLVRKSSIQQGNPTPLASFGTTPDDSEWEVYPADTFDYIGAHTMGNDLTPPEITNVFTQNSTTVVVQFNEQVDETTATATANYFIDGGIGNPSVVVLDAGATSVTLTVAELSITTYMIMVNGVEDLAGNAMEDVSFYFDYTAALEEGDVVINEIGEPYDMPGTWSSSYLELYNTTDHLVDLSGCIVHSVEVTSEATSTFTIPDGTTMDVDGYLIITRDRSAFLADYGTYVDSTIVPIPASTSGTGVYIADDYYFAIESSTGATIDQTTSEVAWNSMVYEKSEPTASGLDPANWNITGQTTPVQGTPGQPNSGGITPAVYTINQLQTENHTDEYVQTSGTVAAVYQLYYTIQDGTGEYSGIWVEGANMTLGDNVTVTGYVREDYDALTIIEQTEVEVTGAGTVPAPEVLTTAVAGTEPWEGVLVTCTAECDNENPDDPEDYNEWSIDDGSGSLRVNDLGYIYEPTLGNVYQVTGPVNFSFDNFKLEPRDANDVLSLSGLTVNPQLLEFLTLENCLDGLTFTITNNADVALDITALEQNGNFAPSPAVWFVEPAVTLPYTMDPGDELTLTVSVNLPVTGGTDEILIDYLDIETTLGNEDVELHFQDELISSATPSPVAVTGLLGNYPNPFNPSTTLHYSLAAPGQVRIEVFNSKGAKVRTLVDTPMAAGLHSISWDGTDDNGRTVTSGIYFSKFSERADSGSDFTSVKKMIVLK